MGPLGHCTTITDLEILGNLTDKMLEGKLPDEKLSALLVLVNFMKSDSSRTEMMRLLHTTSHGL